MNLRTILEKETHSQEWSEAVLQWQGDPTFVPFESHRAKLAEPALERGTPIGPYDVMIAGSALRRGLVMVTSNGGEFERVHGLLLEDWRAE